VLVSLALDVLPVRSNLAEGEEHSEQFGTFARTV
jgi:hypothetical protein